MQYDVVCSCRRVFKTLDLLGKKMYPRHQACGHMSLSVFINPLFVFGSSLTIMHSADIKTTQVSSSVRRVDDDDVCECIHTAIRGLLFLFFSSRNRQTKMMDFSVQNDKVKERRKLSRSVYQHRFDAVIR